MRRRHWFAALSALALLAIAGRSAVAQWLSAVNSGNGQFIASINLSGNTFTAATANAQIGTVSVVMRPPNPAFNPNFPGALTITGPNSCGFYFVGTAVKAGPSGCSAIGGRLSNGVYDDWQIVAAQPNGAKLIVPQAVTAIAAGSLCAIGPSYTRPTPPGLPAGWICAANYAFYDNSYSNISSWLGCSTSSGFNHTPGFQWYHDTAFGLPLANLEPCSEITITTDNGRQVLSLGWLSSNYENGSASLAMNTVSNGGSDNVTDFPQGKYIQFKARLTTNTLSTPNGADNAGIWAWATPGTYTSGVIEEDYTLWDPGGQFTGFINWAQSGACTGQAVYCADIGNGGQDMSVYHTVGVRVTHNGATDMQACQFFDGTFNGCFSVFNGTPLSDQFGMRHPLTISIGGVAQTYSILVDSIQVFTCPAWRNTSCAGTIMTGP